MSFLPSSFPLRPFTPRPYAFAAASFALIALPAFAGNFPVNSDATLRTAITSAASGDTITFGANITLTADLPAVQKGVSIIGTHAPSNYVLDGASTYRGFFVANFNGGSSLSAVTVTIQDLTIQNTKAKGGSGANGAGGGAGLGGAVFVANLASVTLNNVALSTNNATGGAGGGSGLAGSGGGMGGNGAIQGGGGGLGLGADGGPSGVAGGPGIATGATSAGSGNGGTGAGGINGGGGGGFGNGSGGGGVGGETGGTIHGGSFNGGNGGYGGGGGFGNAGGAGGFGGGGGVGGGGFGAGNGGFGGGAGGGVGPGVSGFGGGAVTGGSGGSGGAGLGGALFVQQGGTLTLSGPLTINGNTVAAGAGGPSSSAGSAFGSALFIQGNTTVTFSPAVAVTQTISDVIADQSGNGGSGGNAGAGGLTLNGAGTLVLGGVNTYSGATTLSAGTLRLDGSLGALSAVTIASGGTLSGVGTAGGGVALVSGGQIIPGDGAIGTLSIGGALTWNGSGGAAAMPFELSTVDSTSDELAITGALTKGTAGTFKFDFQGMGHGPLTTYILMTFASTTFTAGDFTYANLAPGLSGSFSIVGGTSLRFTIGAPAPAPATSGFLPVAITLGNLAQVYDGTPKSVTVATSPAGVEGQAVVTYNGFASVPTAAGTYVVVALIENGTYQGVTSASLVIAKAVPALSWTTPAAISYGTALSSAQLNASANMAGTFTYAPASGSVLGAGNQTLVATFAAADTANYNSPATASVSLAIKKVPQVLNLASPANQSAKSGPLALPGATSAGMPLTYSVVSGPVSVSGSSVVFAGTAGPVTLLVSQAGDANTLAATQTLTFSVFSPSVLTNVSALGKIGSNQSIVTGFVAAGSGSKQVLVRGIGPSLVALGVAGALASPMLQLFDGHGTLLLSNSVWGGGQSLATAFAQTGAFALAGGSADSAALATVTAGSYSLVVSGSGASSGTTLSEIYDTSASPTLASLQLVNFSARGQVGSTPGASPLVGGFVVNGTLPLRLLVRGVGPALATYGITGALGGASLAVYDNQGFLLARNDAWGTQVTVNPAQPAATAAAVASAAVATGAFPLTSGSADCAVLITLQPGNYTAQISAAPAASGVGLVEVYVAQ